ncbi:hypothetical protein OQX61_03270 [Pedobacter sp. PLR]|uniref:DUF6660 family protein n=1 Tax=Pedobacter sp. PLR TaxID=2994465 RepID=UPI002247BA26|nr:DUF6660 family protein [Pedobacter sp. PLR]MCX2450282.1 hypothetical protein [Pedobacter sp. PLR]
MRYLAYIFTIVIMALSVWPCCDDEAKISTEQTHISEVQDIPCDQDPGPHTCSPFFHCSTCQAFAIPSPGNFINTIVFSKKEVSYPELPAAPLIVFAGDIWQPPQLG